MASFITRQMIEMFQWNKGNGYRTTHGSSYFKTYATASPCM